MWKLKVEISLPHWLKKWPSVGVVLSKSLCILSKCLRTLSYECCSQRPVVSGVVWDDSLHPFVSQWKLFIGSGPGLLQVCSCIHVSEIFVSWQLIYAQHAIKGGENKRFLQWKYPTSLTGKLVFSQALVSQKSVRQGFASISAKLSRWNCPHWI